MRGSGDYVRKESGVGGAPPGCPVCQDRPVCDVDELARLVDQRKRGGKRSDIATGERVQDDIGRCAVLQGDRDEGSPIL
jgi:hypothetical protein